MVKSTDLLNIQRPLQTNEQAQSNLMQNHKDRVNNLSDEKQLIKLCKDARFVKTIATGQYFMTNDAEACSEFDGHVTCRGHTLPRDDESWTPKDGFVRPVLEMVTDYHEGKQESRWELILHLETDLILVDQNFERTQRIRERPDRESKKTWRWWE